MIPELLMSVFRTSLEARKVARCHTRRKGRVRPTIRSKGVTTCQAIFFTGLEICCHVLSWRPPQYPLADLIEF